MPIIAFTLNGQQVSIEEDDETPLLDALRNVLGLKGSRFGCGLEQCGACMVLVDGKTEKSCGRPLWSIAGKNVLTIEGLGSPSNPHVLQQAFIDVQAGQCGYCLSGILIAAKALLDANPSPTRADIVRSLEGNLCRCGTHGRIIKAVELAAQRMSAGSQA